MTTELISWLNTNQGAMMALLTLVYVLATILMAILMLRANTLSKANLEQVQLIEKERVRPNIIYEIIVEDKCVFAELRNEGLTSAKNINVNISPELTEFDSDRNLPLAFTSSEISYLGPNKKLKDFISVGHKFLAEEKPLEYTCNISYESSWGTTYNDTIVLNLGYLKKIIRIVRPDQASEIEKMREELQKLNRTLTKLPNLLKANTDNRGV